MGLGEKAVVAAEVVAQEAEKSASVYEQLDLFGDIFERIVEGYVCVHEG